MNAAKELFERCRRIDQRINGKVEESKRLRTLAYKATACYSDEPRSGNPAQSRVENGALKLIELEREINADIDALVDSRQKARRIMDDLPDDRYRDILMWRYFSCWNWDKIADGLGYNDRTQVWRLHGRALLEANTIMMNTGIC